VNLNQSQQQENFSDVNQSSQINTQTRPRRRTNEKKVIYSARFVKENFGDRHVVKPLERFTKTWTFRNNGESDWPEDTLFIQTNGDDLKGITQVVGGPIRPGTEYTITIEL
jgi:hypothetical protein